jgi:hypothetical protein
LKKIEVGLKWFNLNFQKKKDILIAASSTLSLISDIGLLFEESKQHVKDGYELLQVMPVNTCI